MSRTVAVVWHASSCVVAGVLYFFFVLPRWPELMGQTPHSLGTVLRIVVAVLIGQAALPVLFTLLRTRRPEFRTPQLALNLRAWSIGLHVLAAVLVLGTAITEIWVSLDDAGRWLFGIYAAAAAIALLGIFAFYLAWVAEAPPPPPKPVKPKSGRQRRRGRKGPEENSEESSGESTEEPTGESAEDVEETTSADDEPSEDTTEDEPSEDKPAENEGGKLRNRRRRRLRSGVAVDD
ncbi:transmembrane protein [Mycolicibacterium phlei]|uniref:Membrane protein n=1 Tax=Mycolicibacterium phlei DSM 43239 = CCUG 21000 TaxID=1226750 RepID=A0A5N5UTS6_MYCPH|nr:hypothetical protein [Mycolicibacterium phlei]VEG07286.1 transmembrane protein [Mycobacteroides chelonae]AMO59154.1 hypothetical protein MPHLCCUG_00312 [Mycolicibacterium phlei]KAB7752956.1 membrane protein [Mycolicibacterium phlei DSM 43239 = CCUG 21000]KXW61417.1 membrane protein [Mycolicibacterium phlei DSM 43070]KXW62753.1 membrane protein [Mycolicibacterium phlei DSM 43239 = CCUG 21000]